MLPEPLQPMGLYRQFIVYRLEPRANGKTDKLPVNPSTMQVENAHNPAIWTDYETARATAAAFGEGWGIGFVFTENDPFFFADIDGALQSNGQWSDVANDICTRLTGCAVEISQSGTGLHVFGCYEGARPDHSCKNTPLGLELYTSDRFAALTGNCYQGGSAAQSINGQLTDVIATYFPPATDQGDASEWVDAAAPEWNGPADDQELIARAMKSGGASAVFGNKATFADLWTGNIQKLAQAYPAINPEHPYDRSSADAALAQHLAFWTGKNPVRMERLMRQSDLVRDKWDWHKKYIPTTVDNATRKQKDVYAEKRQQLEPRQENPDLVANNPVSTESTVTSGPQYMTVFQQQEYFAGCAYIQDRHRTLTPGGEILKPEQFKATYGGFEFAMEVDGSKSTKNAWEAFTEGRGVRFPKVNTTCFRPHLEPGSTIREEGRLKVNVYTPIDTPREQGDASPFLNHLAKVLPNEQDRAAYLAYMAAIVQYPGVKFQWCPILQGAEGNGKTVFSRCVAYAVGQRYSHFPNAADLGGNGLKFNGWIEDKVFISIEEIYVSDRRELSEPLKVYVTNDRIEIQAKGQDQRTGDNFANIMMFTNHKDAMSITVDSRRYAVFYSAQQAFRDLVRDGMDGDYFPNLYDWLKGDGYAIVNDYLRTYQIPDHLNPATRATRAPQTSSHAEAILLSLGGIEQEILEVVDEGRPGFAGGWISSKKLDDLLKELGRRIPRNKRRELLKTLGYDYHPGLADGRCSAGVPIEGGKPRLFVKSDHPSIMLNTPGEITRQYILDQGYPQFGGA
jgi:hypothetical protein